MTRFGMPKRILAAFLSVVLLLGALCVLPVAAGEAVTVSGDQLTEIVFSEFFTAADKGDTYSGNLYIEPQDGNDLRLTIDATIQEICEKAMRECYAVNKAQAVHCIAMDPYTGEILGLSGGGLSHHRGQAGILQYTCKELRLAGGAAVDQRN